MKVLVIGRGGREHVIASCVKKSKLVDKVYVAPGNGGMIKDFCLVAINEDEVDKLVNFALEKSIDLTIVGPELSLSCGIVDAFNDKGLKIFGPTKKATKIESSKEYAKDLMKKYGIPTAKYEVFSDYDLAVEYAETMSLPIVIKYDGLAAGKGVVIAHSMNEVCNTLKLMLVDKVYGSSKVVIEEYLDGVEFSLMAMVNGSDVYAMEVSQDHKQLNDGDIGPNTGGMGAFSPVDIIDENVVLEAVESIMKPIAKAMDEEDTSFLGFLYGGLILTEDGVKVIEFNARFGDPEAEVVLPRLESDLVEHVIDIMDKIEPKMVWSNNYIVGVVMASKGYPESYEKNYLIEGDLENVDHMGTRYNDGYYTDGGRVLLVNGQGITLDDAISSSYKNVEKITCDNLMYRKDIGKRKRNDT
ncbi:MAG: phosphoribosylamine--glycine ligase [Bacilli bacterium]